MSYGNNILKKGIVVSSVCKISVSIKLMCSVLFKVHYKCILGDLGHDDICFLFLGLSSINNAFTYIYEAKLIQLVVYLYLHVSDDRSSPKQLGEC